MRLTIADLIGLNARSFPNRVAAEVIDGESATYAQLWQQARQLANAIGSIPAGPNGPMVAFLMSNGIEPILAFLACQMRGCAAVPVNTRFAPAEILHVLRDSGATVLLSCGDQLDRARAAAITAGIRLVDAHAIADAAPPSVETHAQEDIGAKVGVVFYTSGTTGFPKGAAITNEAWIQRLLWWGWEFEIDAEDVMFVPGPIFHMGFSSMSLCSLLRGGRLRILGRYDAAKAYEELRDRCTWALLIPTMTTMMVEMWRRSDRTPLKAAQHLLSSGAALTLPVLQDAMRMFPNAKIVEAYGWTEGSWVTKETKRPDTLVVGSVGWPAFGSSVMVVDEQGKPCAPGTAGEIVACSPVPFSHYLNRADATAVVWRQDGFQKSGDIGMFLDDGRLVILDRRVDMIVTGGENVYSAEVERVLLGCPGVRECVVVGQPDPRWGQAVTAVVAMEPGAPLDAEGVRAHCRTELAGYKCPKQVLIVDELPRNSMGKVEKFRVRKMLAEGQAPSHP